MSSEKINKPREGIPRGRCGKSMGVTPWRRLLKIGLKKLRIGLYFGWTFLPIPDNKRGGADNGRDGNH
jgi:hypothetical protein